MKDNMESRQDAYDVIIKTEGEINEEESIKSLVSSIIYRAVKDYRKVYSDYLKILRKHNLNINSKNITFRIIGKDYHKLDNLKKECEELENFLLNDELYSPLIFSDGVKEKVFYKVKREVEEKYAR